MKNALRLTIITFITVIILACGGKAAVPIASQPPTPALGYTITPGASSTPIPILPTHTPTMVPTYTATMMPSSLPTDTPTATPDRIAETIIAFPQGTVRSVSIRGFLVNSLRDFWIFQSDQILHFHDGVNDIQVSIDDLIEYALAFEISPDKTIWLFDVGEWPRPWSEIRLLQIDEQGTLLTEYILPKSILVDASGDYIEDDPDLWWEPDGSLILGGDNYIYQLLDETGNLNVERRSGFRTEVHEYKVVNYYGTQDQPALISVDGITIPIVSTYDTLVLTNGTGWGFLGARPNGDFYVQVYEYDEEDTRVTYQRIAIRKYDVDGNLIKELVLLEKNIPNWDEKIPSWQFPITIMGKDGQLYAFLPGNKNLMDQLVSVLID